MSEQSRVGSAASRVFAMVALSAAVIIVALAAVLVLDAQRSERSEAEEVTGAVASSLAKLPDVVTALSHDDAATALQPTVEEITDRIAVDFITIMTADGVRVTHLDRSEIGEPYLGTIPTEPITVTEEFTGTLGPSVRTIVPVLSGPDVVGWVSVGVTTGSISSELMERLPFVVSVVAALLAAGLIGALVARRTTRRVTGDLSVDTIRDAVASYESVRTLGEALRAQTHEHGNRMHTAVSLLELGRTREAIDLLTETSRQSQVLVDQVTDHDGGVGDPTIGALLLGKAAQARERGLEWSADIDPAAPRSGLSAVDAVSVVGNLIDNAMDAAAAGSPRRWVRVVFSSGEAARDGLRIEVSDSGRGIPAELRDRIYEYGFSTKPAGSDGHGVGLALASTIVNAEGGSITVHDDPTTFIVMLPAGQP